MAVRWVLSVIAIIIFSWIANKIVRDEDLPKEEIVEKGLYVNSDACMGCSQCVKCYPELFELKNKKAVGKSHQNPDMRKLRNAIEACPVKAISYKE